MRLCDAPMQPDRSMRMSNDSELSPHEALRESDERLRKPIHPYCAHAKKARFECLPLLRPGFTRKERPAVPAKQLQAAPSEERGTFFFRSQIITVIL